MASNHNKLKISGNVIKTDRVSEDDYSNGINSEDQMLNVRFESTEEGLKAIYNAAPVISLVPESNNSSRIQNTSESIVNLGGFSHYCPVTTSPEFQIIGRFYNFPFIIQKRFSFPDIFVFIITKKFIPTGPVGIIRIG